MTDWQLETPVVLIIFNRPEITEKVFQKIAQAKPFKLFVIADGPRQDRPEDIESCAAARAVIDRVDWRCEVLTNYASANLGCARRVSSGLDWVFDSVERAIILEDDCVPHPSFFRFCEELLEKYCDDERIMVVSGNNFQRGRRRTDDSYYFSLYPHCWGWATWRRAWQHYDHEMKLWPIIRDMNWLKDVLFEDYAVKYWTNIFEAVYEDRINAWASRWVLACWLQNGLTILPNINLVSNIGFGPNATHTTKMNWQANLPVAAMDFPQSHPAFVVPNRQADQFTQTTLFGSADVKTRIKRKIKKLISLG